MRVLVVDDSESISFLLQRALEAEGMECDVAGTTERALAQVQRSVTGDRDYDVILLDLGMPDHPASWLLDNLRKTIGKRCPRIIVCSASCTAVAEAAALGVDACVRKPFILDDLLEQLHDVAGNRAALKRELPRALALDAARPAVS